MTHVACRLTAKNRDQLRNPMLGNRVWTTFTFLNVSSGVETQSGPQFGEHDSRGTQTCTELASFVRNTNVHKCGLAQSPSDDCGQRLTMNHIVDMYPLTTFDGGLNLLHEADDDVVIQLESAATAALAK